MNEGETFGDADARTRYEAATDGRDITITHREALRRVRDLGVLGDLRYLADELRGLIAWDWEAEGGRQWVITEPGRALLAAHDRLAGTRRVARPRLEPRPLPAGWRIDLGRGYVHQRHGWHSSVQELNDHDTLSRRLALVRDTLALLEWIEHSLAYEAQERAVEAQEAQR